MKNDNRTLAEKFAQKQAENISEEEIVKNRNFESRKNHPEINVDDDEYVVVTLRRNQIGIYGIIATGLSIFIILVSVWILLCFTPNQLNLTKDIKNILSLIFGSFSLLTIISSYIGYNVYKANRLVITNERVIQWIVNGLFHKRKQVINLESIEDISFSQVGVLEHVLGFGTVRMSTIGDETTYTFPMISNPAKYAELLGEIAEACRNNKLILEKDYQLGKKISR